MNYLSLDVGTTCCKCQLFSESGEILAYKSEEYPLAIEDGISYVDIEGVWRRVKSLIAYAATIADFGAMCISTFGESFVMLDKSDRVLSLPMLYTDLRGEEEAAEITAKFGAAKLYESVGAVPQSLFSVSKLLWIKKHRPELYGQADKVFLICDYLGYMLTGERVIDYGLAARSGAFGIHTLQFDKNLLGGLGIDAKLFSAPVPTGTRVGKMRKELCKELGIKGECMLSVGSHDQVCSALGAGAVEAGDAVDGMGTVECITTLFSRPLTSVEAGQAGYVCVPYAVPGLYSTYMFNYTSGGLISWYRNKILHDYRGDEANFFAYMEKGIKGEPTGILTLPYLAGAATPYADIAVRGAVVNISSYTTDTALYQSMLESTAMEMRLNAETVEKFGVKILKTVATGGGANSRKWLRLKADIQNVPIATLRSSEGGLCGCAMLSAVSAGHAANLKEAAKIFVRYDEHFEPDEKRHAAYEEQYSKYKKLYAAVKEINA